MKSVLSKNNMTYIKGDLFDHILSHVQNGINGTSILVPHVCNNINLFGAGFAGAVSKHFPIVKENYHLMGKFVLGQTQYVKVFHDKQYDHSLTFANMIAQNNVISTSNPRPLNYGALTESMISIKKFIVNNFDKDQRVQIHCPKFGCGLAGGNWIFIQELIKDIWSNIPVLIYIK